MMRMIKKTIAIVMILAMAFAVTSQTYAADNVVESTLKSVVTSHNVSYKDTITDTISVSPAYGRTVKLYRYDAYKDKWILKKTYTTENKKTAKVTIKYPKIWKSYSKSKWKILCPEVKQYDADKKQYTVYTRVAKAVNIYNKIGSGKASIIMDAQTGEILYAQNAKDHLKVASVTKMVTMMLVDDKNKYNSEVTITDEVVKARKMSGGMGLEKGDVVEMRDLVHATLMESANDAAAAAACGVSGTQKEFATLMKKKAESLGAKDTTYEYAFGDWHSDTHSTAYDQALIGRAFMTDKKYSNLRKVVKKESFTFTTEKKKIKYTVTMGEMSTALIKNGRSIGIKSGCNPPAGYCYANAWKHNDKMYISIVLGASSSKTLISSQKALMKFGDYSVDHKLTRITL